MISPSTQELLRELVIKLVPSMVLSGVHTYTVGADNGDGTLNLNPGPGVLHPPRLRVGQWAAPGIEATLTVSDKVLVAFADNDPAKPVLLGHMPLRVGMPASLRLDVKGTGKVTVGDPLGTPKPVGLVGSTVEVSVTFTPGSGGATLVNGGPLKLTGTITGGSTKLQAE